MDYFFRSVSNADNPEVLVCDFLRQAHHILDELFLSDREELINLIDLNSF
jgi:hypothetical protein